MQYPLSEYEELRQVAEVAFKTWQTWAGSDKLDEVAQELLDMEFVEAMGVLGVILRNHEQAAQRRAPTKA
jgi:hypothetical protein